MSQLWLFNERQGKSGNQIGALLSGSMQPGEIWDIKLDFTKSWNTDSKIKFEQFRT